MKIRDLGAALLDWCERALPMESREDIPEFLLRVAEAFEAKSANIGERVDVDGVALLDAMLDAIVLAGIHSFSMRNELLDEAFVDIVAAATAAGAGARDRIPTVEVVAALRAGAARRARELGRPLRSIES